MAQSSVTTVDAAECRAIFAGESSIGAALPVTDSTWRHLYRSAFPTDVDPWWISTSAFDPDGPWPADGAAALSALAWVDPALDYFRGHFPGAPILPGVVQLRWAATLAAALLQPGEFAGLARVKFKAPVMPGAVLRLALYLAPGKLRLQIDSNAGVHTEGQLLYRD